MSRSPAIRALIGCTASAIVLQLVLTGCAGAPGAPDPSATTEAPALPAEPRVLFEWYPDGAEHKTVMVSSADLTTASTEVVAPASANNVHADWAPDGRSFAWEVLIDDGPASIWIADADGTDPHEAIACMAEPCLQMSWPAWSPDGTSILVVRYDALPNGDWGPSHLVDVDLATGEQTILASTADGARAFYTATWSPDGSRIAVQTESYPDATESEITGSVITVFDADPSTDDAGVAITDPALFAGFPDWHPTDDLISFASWNLDAFHEDEPSQLYTIHSDGTGLRQLTDVDTATVGRPGSASWTADGTRLIAGVGIVEAGRTVDVKLAYVDPATGDIDESGRSGVLADLQP